jgi:hypothetical protein
MNWNWSDEKHAQLYDTHGDGRMNKEAEPFVENFT